MWFGFLLLSGWLGWKLLEARSDNAQLRRLLQIVDPQLSYRPMHLEGPSGNLPVYCPNCHRGM